MKGEAINVRSRDIAKKLLFHFDKICDHQTWSTAGLICNNPIHDYFEGYCYWW